MPGSTVQPNPWLRELARPKPAVWQWNRSIRAAIGIALPLTVGYLANISGFCIWMSIATLMFVTAESSGSYRSRFKQTAITASIGVFGCLLGYLAFLPWVWVVLVMALLGLLCGIISSYGAPFSQGALHLLVIGAVALGEPLHSTFWQQSLAYIAGVGFFSAILGAEALLLRSRPQRDSIASLINALSALALARANAIEGKNPQAATQLAQERRRKVTAQTAALYADVLHRRSRKAGRTSEIDSVWATLQCCDTVFTTILSVESAPQLHNAAQRLSAIAAAVAAGKKTLPTITPGTDRTPSTSNAFRTDNAPTATCTHANAPAAAAQPDTNTPANDTTPPANDTTANAPADTPTPSLAEDALERALNALAGAGLWSHSPFSPLVMTTKGASPTAQKPQLAIILDRLNPGRETVRFSIALAICIGISYAARWFDSDPRWYWIPLTVALVMKPDFGSIFARSLLRSIGTLAGAVIGSVLLLLLPKSFLLACVLALIASTLPWAAQYSYALCSMVITPLVLVLLDLALPDVGLSYAAARLIDTLIGAGIALVFGYFLWPRTHAREISGAFRNANQSIADYLLSAAGQTQSGPAMPLSKRRRIAYAKLGDLRLQLQKVMAEPPPAGQEASAWLPTIASAERICDLITAYSVKIQGRKTPEAHPRLIWLAQAIRNAPALPPAQTATEAKVNSEAKTATEAKANVEIKADAEARTAQPPLPAAESELSEGIADELAFIHASTLPSAPTHHATALQTPATA